MKKGFLLLGLTAVLSTAVSADMPGNTPRKASILHLKNIDLLGPYTLMIEDYGDSFITITADTVYTVKGGYGAPKPAILFAVHKELNTDTLFFNADGSNIELNFSAVINNRLQYTQTYIAADEENNDATNAIEGNDGISNTNKWLIGISVGALAGLIAWFAKKKKKRYKSVSNHKA